VTSDRPRGSTPCVSVIMATYNGARFIADSISSVLAQTWRNFELIIIDDCSTDGTSEILESIRDPRVRALRNTVNLGVVRSRNRCFAEANGRYTALLDHDDLSRPTRLAKQVGYLDSHPDTVLVGTAAHVLDDRGRVARTRHPRQTSPILIQWLLHVANPLICSSVMFRSPAAARFGYLMREDYEYADDYDLYHRFSRVGDIARLDEPLTVYRLHSSNAFRRHEETMTANAVKVLAPALAKWFGNEAAPTAALIVNHLAVGRPVPDMKTLAALHQRFEHLNTSFMAEHEVGATDREAIQAHADRMWATDAPNNRAWQHHPVLRAASSAAVGFENLSQRPRSLGSGAAASGQHQASRQEVRRAVGPHEHANAVLSGV
jgi:GT2 family glycosyltransferase